MLSNIATFWPPNPGPQQTETGTKTRQTYFDTALVESLADLHEPAWWSGLRISTPHKMGFHVRLLRRDGSPVFESADEWTQPSGEWRNFPWPIPAAMGRELGIRLEVVPIDPADNGMLVVLTTCFHELPLMGPRDRYLFVNAEGAALQIWDGKRHISSSPQRGPPPAWRTIHSVVPPLLEKWTGALDFCIHDWTETVS